MYFLIIKEIQKILGCVFDKPSQWEYDIATPDLMIVFFRDPSFAFASMRNCIISLVRQESSFVNSRLNISAVLISILVKPNWSFRQGINQTTWRINSSPSIVCKFRIIPDCFDFLFDIIR